MIQKVDIFSLFFTDKVLKKIVPKESKSRWKFIHTRDAISKEPDCFIELLPVLKGDRELHILDLRKYLEKRKGIVGIEVKDGLFVKIESLGRWMLKRVK